MTEQQTEPTPNILYRSPWLKLRSICENQYKEQLEAFGVKGKRNEMMVAAFADGMGSTLGHLINMGLIEVQDDTEEQENADGD